MNRSDRPNAGDAPLAPGSPRDAADAVPGTTEMIRALCGITLKRLVRGKALWIGGAFGVLPVIMALAVRAYTRTPIITELFGLSMLLLALLPAMLVASSVGEDLEDGTSAYLWSRPIARWAVLAGKLCALTPIAIAILVAGWIAAIAIDTAALPSFTSCAGIAVGCVATSLVVAGIATVVPRFGMALAIGYMLVDLFIGAIPLSLGQLSITYQTARLAGQNSDAAIVAPLIGLAVIAGIWTAIAVRRIRRLEP
jgi:ABC-type transport system involved in multi-copper enzyme maturation permease subunit